MHVTRIQQAKPYDAKLHHVMTALQLQGGAASETKQFTLGLSHFLPGGGAEASASNTEKIYLVISGEVTIVTAAGEVTPVPGIKDSGYFVFVEVSACHLQKVRHCVTHFLPMADTMAARLVPSRAWRKPVHRQPQQRCRHHGGSRVEINEAS